MAQSHPQLAITGWPVGDEIPYCPLYHFLFSNPFQRDSPIIARSPLPSTRAHHIPIIPLQKPIFINTDNPDDSLTWSELHQESLAIGQYLNHELGLNPPPFVQDKPAESSSTRPSSLLSPVVLLHLENGSSFAVMLVGSLAAGLTVTMVNPTYTCEELKFVLLAAKPSVVVTTPIGLKTMLEALVLLEDAQMREKLMSHICLFDDETPDRTLSRIFRDTDNRSLKAPNGENAKLIHRRALTRPKSQNSCYEPFRFNNPEGESRSRIAVILWSSGTGDRSKGVLCSHHAIINSVISFWHQKLEYGADQRVLGLVPFYHVMGRSPQALRFKARNLAQAECRDLIFPLPSLILGLLTVVIFPIIAGSTVYIMRRFEPRNFLRVITTHRLTSLQIAPPVAAFLAKSPLLDEGHYDLSSVNNSMSGGAQLSPEIVKSIFNRCGFVVTSGYGLSEAGHVANQLGSSMDELLDQLGTVGQAMYGNEIKILSTQTLQIVNKQEEGEILVRSPSLMNSYLNDDTETQKTLDQDGWLHTGDLGILDVHNRLVITGRLKEIIKVKGFQVSAADLERLISQIEAVGEVAVAPFYCNDQASEFPRAYVVPQDQALFKICESVDRCGPSEFDPTQHPRYNDLVMLALQIKQLVESHTVNYKWLRGNIVLTSHIPKSPSGKVLKRNLPSIPGIEIRLYKFEDWNLPTSKL